MGQGQIQHVQKSLWERKAIPPELTYDSGQEGSNFVSFSGRGGTATPRNKQGSCQPAQSGRGSTATPGSSSMYTRETFSEMITNTVPDEGGIPTLRTTTKTGRGDNVTPSNKTGRGDKVTPNNNKTGLDGRGIATLKSAERPERVSETTPSVRILSSNSDNYNESQSEDEHSQTEKSVKKTSKSVSSDQTEEVK